MLLIRGVFAVAAFVLIGVRRDSDNVHDTHTHTHRDSERERERKKDKIKRIIIKNTDP